MKKPGLLFIIAACLIAILPAKGQTSPPFSYRTVEIDYATGSTQESVKYHLSVDVPTSNNRLSSAVSNWIEQQLDVTSLSKSTLDRMVINYLADTQAQLAEYNDPYGAEKKVDIKCKLLTDGLVTYENSSSEQVSTGWGYNIKGITFDANTGAPLTWDIIPAAKKTSFYRIALPYLKNTDYVGWNPNVSVNDFPESELPPVFTEEGLFWFSQINMRISASFTIPYSKLRDVVRPEIARLFPR